MTRFSIGEYSASFKMLNTITRQHLALRSYATKGRKGSKDNKDSKESIESRKNTEDKDSSSAADPGKNPKNPVEDQETKKFNIRQGKDGLGVDPRDVGSIESKTQYPEQKEDKWRGHIVEAMYGLLTAFSSKWWTVSRNLASTSFGAIYV